MKVWAVAVFLVLVLGCGLASGKFVNREYEEKETRSFQARMRPRELPVVENLDGLRNDAGTLNAVEEHLHRTERNPAAVTAAVLAGILLTLELIERGVAFYKTGNPSPTGAILGQIKQLNNRLDRINDRLDRLSTKMNSVLNSIRWQAQWTRVIAVFGKDVQRLKYFINYLTDRLDRDRHGRIIVNKDAKKWAESVLSRGADGVDQVLLNVHDMVVGVNPLYGAKSIVHIYIDSMDKSSPNLFKDVDQMIELLIQMQYAGYSAWGVALHISGQHSLINSKVRTLAQERLTKQVRLIFGYLEDKRIRYWPEGSYGLVNVKDTGCPIGTWFNGKRKHDTQDWSASNKWSSPLHMGGWWKKDNMEWEFCMAQNNHYNNKTISVPLWPKGTYCLFAKKGCPPGFQMGHIQFDDENWNNKNSFSGILPDGKYDKNTRYNFCCRGDGSTGNAIKLPQQKPFIMFPKHNHPCQQVEKMVVKEEWFRWDCEDKTFGKNKNERVQPYPKDGDNDQNVKLYMCYYERTPNY